MKALDNSIVDGNCIKCGIQETMPRELNSMWVCKKCQETEQKKYAEEIENEYRRD